MTLRCRIAVPFLLGALALPAAPAAAQEDPAAQKVIAAGVSAGGVEVGGHTVASAAAHLEGSLRRAVERPVVVRSGGRRFRLTAAQARVAFDPLRTAKRAYYAGRDAGPAAASVDVPLALGHSRAAVRAFTERVDRAVSRRPRNASVRITLTRIFVRKGRSGRTMNEHEVARRIDRALGDPSRRRTFRGRLRPDRPDVRTRDLRRRYGTVLTVDRRGLRLRLFKRLRHRRTYRIAIGMAGYETPSGTFSIQSKQVNPAWHVPNSAWAGSLAGTTVPGGAPNNPLKARWLGVSGSVGIHGTAEDWSIGTRASHGCIRMRVGDVIDLYRRVPLGSTVVIR